MAKEIEMVLPEDVEWIIRKLEQEGYEAYAVGGCVRDSILSRVPEDWDITTSAKPQQIKEIFPHTIDTGIQHGTVTVMRRHVGYEVTTYRIDGEYEDKRHPKQVEFTSNLLLDLERRDFTINAMAYNPRKGLVDAFDGIGDLKRGIICCVGDPGMRFDEDALRMLRAVRFSGQLGFHIEAGTRQAIVERAKHLEHISAERIRVELMKLLLSKHASEIQEAYETGMTAVFLPEFDRMMETDQQNPHHIYNCGEHSVHGIEVINHFFGCNDGVWDSSIVPTEVDQVAKRLAADCSEKEHQILCLTLLLHDVAKPLCKVVDDEGVGHFYGHPAKGSELSGKILKRLTFDNETIHAVERLIYSHDDQIQPQPKSVRKAMSKLGKELMPLLILLQFADILSQNPLTFEKKLARVLGVERSYWEIMEAGEPLTVKDLAVGGSDLIALGMSPGPRFREILQALLAIVLEEPEKNNREILLDYVKQQIHREGNL